MPTILPSQIYEHYKGGQYKIIALGRDQELQGVVVYKSLQAKGKFLAGSVWVRPQAEFESTVKINKQTVPRFRLIAPGSSNLTLKDFFSILWPPFAVFMFNYILFGFFPLWYITRGIDTPIHFLGGLSIAISTGAAVRTARKLNWPSLSKPHQEIIFILFSVVLVAIVWEIFELLSDQYLGSRYQASNFDTVKDFLMGLGGAAMYCVYLLKARKAA